MRKQCAVSLIAIMTALGTVSAVAQAADGTKTEIKIEAQPLDRALSQLGLQFDTQIVVFADDATNLTAKSLEGKYTETEALNDLLNGSGLEYRRVNDRMIAVGTPDRLAANYTQEEVTEPAPQPFRVAQLGEEDDVRGIERDVVDEERREDVIVVTGTNIRGAAPVGSPLQQFDREDIARSGRATIQDFLDTVPQNFGGGVSQDGLRDGTGGATNLDARAGINLRGLGNGATLVLLNGNRLAAGANGAFVDISILPVSVIERIDILPDGASAIYGSDAIAGVVNLVLRDDFEGAETSLRYGSVTEGSQSDFRATQTFGNSWGSGRALLSYDYFNRTELGTDERSFTETIPGPSSLVPNSENHSVFGSVFQDINSDVEAFVTAFYGTRATDTVVLDNQGFQLLRDVDVEQLNITGGLSARLGADWVADVSATLAQDSTDTSTEQQSATLVQEGSTETSLFLADAKLGGTLFELPSGPVRVAFGGQYRREDLETSSLSTVAGVAGDPRTREADRDVFAAFGEMVVPIIKDDGTSPLGNRFDLSIAGRFEDYSDFGSTFDPKFGITYEPINGVSLRGSYSTSFRAPLLFDLDPLSSFASTINVPFFPDPSSPNGFIPFIQLFGSNPDLEPETSENWTFGADIAPSAIPGLTFSVTYFDIAYEGRVAQAATGAELLRIFVDPIYQPVITRNPDINVVNEIYSQPNFTNFFGLDPSQIEAIVDNRLTNLSTTNVEGIDFSVGYQFESGIGSINLQSAGSYYLEFEDRFTDAASPVSILDTAFNPVELQLRNSVAWSNDAWGANLAINYVDSYETFATPPTQPVDSWTTVDLGISYRLGSDDSRSLLQNVNFALNVQNLFDEDPPALNTGNDLFTFDATNSNPLGRFISFQVAKSW